MRDASREQEMTKKLVQHVIVRVKEVIKVK